MVIFCTEQGKNDSLNSNLGSSGLRIRGKIPFYLQGSIYAWLKEKLSGSMKAKVMVLSSLTMVKIVLFTFPRFKVMASKPSMKDRPWNLKKQWVKKDHKPRRLSQNKLVSSVFPRQSLYSAGKVSFTNPFA